MFVSTPTILLSSTRIFSTIPCFTSRPRLLLDGFLHGKTIFLLVSLRARSPDRGALAPVQDPELDAGPVDDPRHLPAQGIDLLHEVPLGKAADRGVAGHERDAVQVHGQHQRGAAHAGGGKRSFAPGMAGADHDDVVFLLKGHSYKRLKRKTFLAKLAKDSKESMKNQKSFYPVLKFFCLPLRSLRLCERKVFAFLDAFARAFSSLSDTKIIKYPLQDVLGIGRADHDPELVERRPQVQRNELGGKIRCDRFPHT